MIEEDRNSRDYWNKRVKQHKSNEQRMIWYGDDWKHEAINFITERILTTFEGCTALDLGCGFGRWCHLFYPHKYLGVDFSSEMISLAKEKNSAYDFEVDDIKTYVPKKKFDLIFEVMSAGDFALQTSEFVEKYTPYANVAVVCIHPTETFIKFIDIS